MVAILFYVKYDKESQMAYKDLMNSIIEFKTFEIRGKNVSERLKSLMITKVPTLVIPSKKQKIEGYLAIKKMIDKVEQYQTRMKRVLREEESSETVLEEESEPSDNVVEEDNESEQSQEEDNIQEDESEPSEEEEELEI